MSYRQGLLVWLWSGQTAQGRVVGKLEFFNRVGKVFQDCPLGIEVMVMLHIVRAEHLQEYMIQVTFNDGIVGVADFKEKIIQDNRPIVQSLQDITLFKDFTIKAHTITWANGLDFAPELIKSLI